MLNPLVPGFRLDLSLRLKNIAEKQVPAKLKPIVDIFLLIRRPKGHDTIYRVLQSFFSECMRIAIVL